MIQLFATFSLTIITLVIWFFEGFYLRTPSEYSYDYQVLLNSNICWHAVQTVRPDHWSPRFYIKVACDGGAVSNFYLNHERICVANLSAFRRSPGKAGSTPIAWGFTGAAIGMPPGLFAAHFQPGDGLIVDIPHVFEYYSKLRG